MILVRDIFSQCEGPVLQGGEETRLGAAWWSSLAGSGWRVVRGAWRGVVAVSGFVGACRYGAGCEDRGAGEAAADARAGGGVVDAYTTLRATLRAGRRGPEGSPRRRKAEGKPVRFRPDAAQPFDDRCLSWQH